MVTKIYSKRLFSFFVIFHLLLSVAFSQSKKSGNDAELVYFNDTELRKLQSKYVDQEYSLEIYFPPSYSDTSKSFPVLYLLDSDKSFGMAKNIVEWLLLNNEIREVIIVGISYREGFTNWWSKRSRDYTPTKDTSKKFGEWPLAGGANNFIKFLKHELIPFIDLNYRTLKNDRSIAGLSFGGLFCTYVLFTEQALFKNYIMSGAAPLFWDNKIIFDIEAKYFISNKNLSATVFTAVGEFEPQYIIQPWKEFNEIIAKRNYVGLNFHNKIFEGETHLSTWPSALTRGIKIIFEKK